MDQQDPNDQANKIELLLHTLSLIAERRGDKAALKVLMGAKATCSHESWNSTHYVNLRLEVPTGAYSQLTKEERTLVQEFVSEEASPILCDENERMGQIDIVPRGPIPPEWRSAYREFADVPVDQQGSMVGARYTLGDVIGRGGFGVVHKARRITSVTEFEFALKILDPSPFYNDREKARARFAREIRAVQQLQHRGIVSYIDADVDQQGRPFLVMQLIHGKNIRAAAEARSFANRGWLMVRVLDAVAHAHSKNVLHRDLKPSNILVRDADDQPFILDFGQAYLLDELDGATLTSTAVGTIGYYPSEVQADPKLRTTGQDIFACGIITYEIFASRRPDPADYQPLESLDPALGCLDPIVKKAIAQASARYESAKQFRDALRQALDRLRR